MTVLLEDQKNEKECCQPNQAETFPFFAHSHKNALTSFSVQLGYQLSSKDPIFNWAD